MKRKRRESTTAASPSTGRAALATAATPSRPWMPLAVVFGVAALLLGIAAVHNRWQFNTDAIAYLRIAGYYASANTDLMISGYWGPMLSWIIAPAMALGIEPLAAARSAMVLSGLVFMAGAHALAGRAGLEGICRWLVTTTAGLAAVMWSVEVISPDLLLAGLMLLAVAELLSDNWLAGRRVQISAGIWWALAYFAKPVAFPLALVVTVVMAAMHGISRTAACRQITVATLTTLGAFALLSAPWVGILSVKYGGFTFSTSGRINHAIVGPGNADNIGRYHPVMREFHVPESGRVTAWEDPSRMEYPWWSPLESAAHFQHQIGLIQRNAFTVAGILAAQDWFSLGLLSLLGCCFLPPPWRASLKQRRWCWMPVPLLLFSGIYLPVYVQPVDGRYFYATMPLLMVAALGVACALTRHVSERMPWPRRLALFAVVASFALYPMVGAGFSLMGSPHEATRYAKSLAEKIDAAGVSGPIAGSGLVMAGASPQRAGLYTAFFLGVPWHGDRQQAGPDDFAQSGARLAVVPRGTLESPDALAARLAADTRFRDLDNQIFGSAQDAQESPLKLFEIMGGR